MTDKTIRLVTPRMQGPAIVRLQELLDLLGYDTGPHDGIFGTVTELAVRDLQRENNIDVDGVCGPVTWSVILRESSIDYVSDSFVGNPGNSSIVDIRNTHPHPRLYARRRKWSSIDGVVLHQTGCRMPDEPQGWQSVNAHIGITRFGKVVLINDMTDMIWHAQRLSIKHIGVEVEGNFEGIKGNARTLWSGGGPAATLTREMINAADAAMAWLVGEFKKQKQLWTRLYAHRQSHNMRQADPGAEVWQEIGMRWLRRLYKNYNMPVWDGGSSYCVGSGRPIPREWNDSYSSRYYD